MAKMTQNMTRKFKITDFLLGFWFRTKRLFCRYCYVTWVYQFSHMYVKCSSRRTPLNIIGGAVEPFCHTYSWNPYQTYIFTSSDACAKFPDFSSMFRSSKMRLSLENNNNNNNNNKRSRFNRVLCTIGARSLKLVWGPNISFMLSCR